MKLALKLIVALMLVISVVMATELYLRQRAQVGLFTTDAERDLRAMAKAVDTGVDAIWKRDGTASARRFVEDVNRSREDVNVGWIWLDEARLPPRLLKRLHANREITFVAPDAEGQDRRYMFWPLAAPPDRLAVLELSMSLETEHAYVANSRRIALLTTIGLFAVCALVVSFAGYTLVGRPLRRLRDKARRVGQGDLSEPLILRQRDEVRELADEINAMCERLHEAQRTAAEETAQRIAALEQLRHVDRLRTVGQLASGVAHELGTPLNVVLGNAKMVCDRELSDQETVAAGEVIVEQTKRMTSIIRQLLDFSRRRETRTSPTDLSDLARRTIDMLTPLAEKENVTLHLEVDGAVTADVDGAQIQQALANLVVNAIQASTRGGHVRVELSGADGEERDERGEDRNAAPNGAPVEPRTRVRLVVEDEGAGIPDEEVGRIFEPFYTTKDVGEGTGLGLSVAYGIVREHGGWIDVDSRAGRGSRFAIVLPVHGSGDATAEASRGAEAR